MTVFRNGVFQHPLIPGNLKSTITSVLSSKPKWPGLSDDSERDGRFSRLEELDDMRPLGHDVDVQAGERASWTNGNGTGMATDIAVPNRRIGVKTEVVVETSERLAYNDRLY